tara:strand:- start:256 stop:450 length:195 start_codon:yes stop_codon:yes gene_type:complete
MTTKFDLNEKVYLICENKITLLEIKTISIRNKNVIEYKMVSNDKDVYRVEKDLFKKKDELIRSL